MSLRITTTNARLGYWTENAQQTIQQPRADLSIEQIPAQLNIRKEPLHLVIDQSAQFAEMGLKTSTELSLENSERSRQIAIQAIAEKAQAGDRLMHTEKGGNAIAENAILKLPGWPEWNIGFIPSTPPKIDWQGGGLDIQMEMGSVQIDAKQNMPIIDATLGQVHYQMLQYNSINIEYLGNNVDKSI